MKNDRRMILAAILMSAALMAGCGKQESLAAQETVAAETEGSEAAAAQDGQETEAADLVIETESADPISDGTEETPETPAPDKAEPEFSFAEVANREFYFSSGAGAWYTVVSIHEDGTFEGHYQDADMGVWAEQYPNGTLYYSDFSGSFTKPEPIDSHTWVFRIASIQYPYGSGEEIKDGYHYIYSTAYGLDGAESLYLYLPGARVEDLPQAYRNWVTYEIGDAGELPFYGLYNEKEECGFSSYAVKAGSDRIAEVVSAAEEKAADVEERLRQAQTQGDMNLLSGELYVAWDEALNTIWGILKETLDGETMEALTVEERAWITQKETAVQEAAAENGGGSLSPLLANQTAADLTRERVYELAKRYGAAE